MEDETGSPSRRVFVFLQMPQSPFPRLFGSRLKALGYPVHKINFCGGDVFHWPYPDAHSYRDGRLNWPAWFDEFMKKHGATDLLLIAGYRQFHHEAVLLAKTRGVRVWVFEEGYFRPDFITLEEGGVNGQSSLPKTPEEVFSQAKGLPALRIPPRLKISTRKMIWSAIRHHTGNVILWPYFLRYKTHRPRMIAHEVPGLLKRYMWRKQRRVDDAAALETFLAEQRKFFFFPMQISADDQIRRYSEFLNVRESMASIIISFARAAPKDAALLVKSHPLDHDIKRHRHYAMTLAKTTGIEDRFCYLDEGGTNKVVERAQGLVLVNSTTGMTGLYFHKPVFCLGKSVYAMPGLATTGNEDALDRFWQNPPQPDAKLLDAFLRVMRKKALLPGNYFTAKGISMAIKGCLDKMEIPVPND